LPLSSDSALTRILTELRVRPLAYEPWQPADGSLPLLASMSEGAGRLSVQPGAWCLQAHNFFFQAEDGIRDPLVTGVQTCALPISTARIKRSSIRNADSAPEPSTWKNSTLTGSVLRTLSVKSAGMRTPRSASPRLVWST